MNQIRYQVEVLKSRFITHQRETDGFKWDFQAASDKDILEMTVVKKDTIDGLVDVIMKIIIPKQRKELRDQISYLIGLQSKQAEVWARFMEDCQNRTNNTNQWVLQNAQ